MGNSSCIKLEPETHNTISSKKWQLMILPPFWLMTFLFTSLKSYSAKFFLDLCYLRNIKIIDNNWQKSTDSFVRNHWSIIFASYWFYGFSFKSREQDITTLQWLWKTHNSAWPDLEMKLLRSWRLYSLYCVKRSKPVGLRLGGGRPNRE